MWHDTKEGLGLGSYWPLFVAGMLLDSHCCGGGYVFSPADLSFLISFLVLGCRLIPVTSGHKDGTFRGRHIWHWLIWTSQVCVIASTTFFVAAMLLPSLHSPLPSEAVRSYRLDLHKVRVMEPRAIEARATEARVVETRASLNSLPLPLPVFRKAPPFRNGWKCREEPSSGSLCSPTYIHIAMTLDEAYLRGSIAAVLSILRHASCPESLFFHFLVSRHYLDLKSLVRSTFPSLKFSVYHFDESLVKHRISPSVRDALTQPLNYARNYLSDILGSCIHRVIYLDSDLVVVDDISKLWSINLGTNAVGAPEYCHANFTKYFTPAFWSDPVLSRTFHGRRPCYFNTGVMVLDLDSWRKNRFSEAIEHWMEVQKEQRIYELGSLPPFLLVFAGNVSHVEHRWNQHGLGGDNGKAGSCRPLHPGPVSLLHWSGTGKPWHRRDSGQPCPLDSLWAPYDLHLTSH